MKIPFRTFTLVSALSLFVIKGNAQTNTFPPSGSVGIGTTTPNNYLQVDDGGGNTASYSQFTNTTTGNNTATKGFLIGIDATGNAVLNSNYATGVMKFLTNGIQVGTFLANGNFGTSKL